MKSLWTRPHHVHTVAQQPQIEIHECGWHHAKATQPTSIQHSFNVCCGLNKVKSDKFTSFIRIANSNFVKYQNFICKLKIYLIVIRNYSSKTAGRSEATFYQLLSLRTALKVCK